ncbi:hypothetical protein MTO96_000007 [Rhipicephalus appendiculatus]
MVLVRKGVDSKSPFTGPYFVTKIAKQQGILKTVYYQGPRGKVEEASLSKVLPYRLRRDGNWSLGGCSDPRNAVRSMRLLLWESVDEIWSVSCKAEETREATEQMVYLWSRHISAVIYRASRVSYSGSRGRKNRQVRSHDMNEHSSRSHSILTISLASEVHDPDDPNTFIRRQGKLSLVDLAGSEKTKKTRSRGSTFVEANNINKSLLVLGNCISCLADPKRRTGHIPYRDSTLTKLLADSLGGTGMALIIACVSPSASNAHETINTLRTPRELLILSLRREVRLLRMENSYLRQQLLNGGGQLHLSNVLAVGGEPSEDGDDKALLHKYMAENEALRVENATMHHMREMLVRDHELVCRENERLIKTLDALEKTTSILEAEEAAIAMATAIDGTLFIVSDSMSAIRSFRSGKVSETAAKKLPRASGEHEASLGPQRGKPRQRSCPPRIPRKYTPGRGAASSGKP